MSGDDIEESFGKNNNSNKEEARARRKGKISSNYLTQNNIEEATAKNVSKNEKYQCMICLVVYWM